MPVDACLLVPCSPIVPYHLLPRCIPPVAFVIPDLAACISMVVWPEQTKGTSQPRATDLGEQHQSTDLHARIQAIVAAEIRPYITTSPPAIFSSGWRHQDFHDEVEGSHDPASKESRSPSFLIQHYNQDVEQEGAQGGTVVDSQEAEEAAEEEDWAFCAENAYGAFIYMSVTASMGSAIIKCGPMVAASVLIQAVFSFELAVSLNSLDLPEQVAWEGWVRQRQSDESKTGGALK